MSQRMSENGNGRLHFDQIDIAVKRSFASFLPSIQLTSLTLLMSITHISSDQHTTNGHLTIDKTTADVANVEAQIQNLLELLLEVGICRLIYACPRRRLTVYADRHKRCAGQRVRTTYERRR